MEPAVVALEPVVVAVEPVDALPLAFVRLPYQHELCSGLAVVDLVDLKLAQWCHQTFFDSHLLLQTPGIAMFVGCFALAEHLASTSSMHLSTFCVSS